MLRLSACPVTIHALLHIADSIAAAGPVWASWAFPMERYCGSLQPAIRSRRFPFASIARYVVDRARLTHIKLSYANASARLRLTADSLDGFYGGVCVRSRSPITTCMSLLLLPILLYPLIVPGSFIQIGAVFCYHHRECVLFNAE